jgi:hypothetical protein
VKEDSPSLSTHPCLSWGQLLCPCCLLHALALIGGHVLTLCNGEPTIRVDMCNGHISESHPERKFTYMEQIGEHAVICKRVSFVCSHLHLAGLRVPSLKEALHREC